MDAGKKKSAAAATRTKTYQSWRQVRPNKKCCGCGRYFHVESTGVVSVYPCGDFERPWFSSFHCMIDNK